MRLALVAMQAPAVTREYQAALLQLVRSSDQEIAQCKASLQREYGAGCQGKEDSRQNPALGTGPAPERDGGFCLMNDRIPPNLRSNTAGYEAGHGWLLSARLSYHTEGRGARSCNT